MKRSLKWSPTPKARFLLLLLPLLVSFHTSARAERLPIKAYTTADGLPHNSINKIKRDSRGFLWFCTDEGLSRFDGYTFTNYTTEHGLPHAVVTDILETREGDYWVATYAGLGKFNPKGVPGARVVYANDASAGSHANSMFTIFVPGGEDRQTQAFTTLLQTRDGTIWCGTRRGLFRLTQIAGRLELTSVDIKLSNEGAEQSQVNTLLEDRHRTLWIGTPGGLYRRWADGTSARYGRENGLPDNHVHDLLEDHHGNLWVGTRVGGLLQLANSAAYEPPTITNTYNSKNGLNADWVFDLFESSDGRLLAATNRGLAEFSSDTTKRDGPDHVYTRKNGFIYHEISNVVEDRDGNLWLGSHAGAMKWAREGFVTYGEQEGFLVINAIFGDQSHVVCFRSYVLGDEHTSVFEGAKLDLLRADIYHLRYGCFDGERFTMFKPALPRSGNFGWVGEGVTLQARNGEWWLGTGEGLYRFPASDNFEQIKTARPLAVYSTKEGLIGSQQVFRIFEDSRGDIWASTAATPNGLARWERASGNLNRDLAESQGLPSSKDDLARSFGEDAEGNVWIGFGSGLARYRQGQFAFFTTNEGLPLGAIQNIYSDRAGRLWLASARSGLVLVKQGGSDRPVFESYSLLKGLSSNRAEVIIEDLNGKIYVGTGRGLDRLDPETSSIKHFTTADGLVSGSSLSAYRDRDGTLWFGTSNGLSRLTPSRQTPANSPPPILITGLKVNGESQVVSALGEGTVALPELPANRNQLQIDFVGLSFAPGDVLRYQYRLEGTNANWSEPSEQRTVNFVNIAPGQYRFLVRAVNSDGVASDAPAVVTFAILHPIWQRWWFLLLAAFAVGLAVYALYRYRVARLLEVANMRTRIATDLHDDIGANLTKIAILSEVARQQLGNGDAVRDRPLSSIARISRESVASMSDIVWAINPQRDTLRDLVRRIRQHAEEVCLSQNIEVTFNAPDRESHLRLGVDIRRDLYLIFKEAITNSVRHSECTRLEIELAHEGEFLTLTIVDNGNGFDPGDEGDGNGLINMRRRAERHAGKLVIESQSGRGTSINVRLPHSRSRRPLPN